MTCDINADKIVTTYVGIDNDDDDEDADEGDDDDHDHDDKNDGSVIESTMTFSNRCVV